MKKHELISSLVWMALGVLFLIGSIGLGPGKSDEPGPGFFPFVMAACLISFSSIHFISSLIRAGQSSVGAGKRFWPKNSGIKRILFTIILLVGFVLALNYLGFILNTFFFMLIMLRLVERQKWRRVLLIGSLTTILSYATFQLWLRSNLPAGFLGF
jgi:putative tricarboxylic transport membrane protein